MIKEILYIVNYPHLYTDKTCIWSIRLTMSRICDRYAYFNNRHLMLVTGRQHITEGIELPLSTVKMLVDNSSCSIVL